MPQVFGNPATEESTYRVWVVEFVVCVCVCGRERETERERECVCMCVRSSICNMWNKSAVLLATNTQPLNWSGQKTHGSIESQKKMSHFKSWKMSSSSKAIAAKSQNIFARRQLDAKICVWEISQKSRSIMKIVFLCFAGWISPIYRSTVATC